MFDSERYRRARRAVVAVAWFLTTTTLWVVALTLLFLATGWPRWAFYAATILGAVALGRLIGGRTAARDPTDDARAVDHARGVEARATSGARTDRAEIDRAPSRTDGGPERGTRGAISRGSGSDDRVGGGPESDDRTGDDPKPADRVGDGAKPGGRVADGSNGDDRIVDGSNGDDRVVDGSNGDDRVVDGPNGDDRDESRRRWNRGR